MLGAGAGGALLGVIASMLAFRTAGTVAVVAIAVAVVAWLAALYGFGIAVYMTYSSRIGKVRTREKLLDLAASFAPWTGREAVLDVGCGRGLMLVGAARRLTTGNAVGVDLWRAEDQSANTPHAALENARLEGLAAHVRVETADAVLSHWVLHNPPDAVGRMRAIDEMLRVLRPGGVLVLADIAHHAEYREALAARGVTEMRFVSGGAESRIMGVLSGGTFRPQAIVALGNKVSGSA
jgi:SAM-dependent methyltransferase